MPDVKRDGDVHADQNEETPPPPPRFARLLAARPDGKWNELPLSLASLSHLRSHSIARSGCARGSRGQPNKFVGSAEVVRGRIAPEGASSSPPAQGHPRYRGFRSPGAALTRPQVGVARDGEHRAPRFPSAPPPAEAGSPVRPCSRGTGWPLLWRSSGPRGAQSSQGRGDAALCGEGAGRLPRSRPTPVGLRIQSPSGYLLDVGPGARPSAPLCAHGQALVSPTGLADGLEPRAALAGFGIHPTRSWFPRSGRRPDSAKESLYQRKRAVEW